MILNEPQNYWIEFLDEGAYRLSSGSGVCSFSKPVTVRGVAKLYKLSDGVSLIYVGVAQQPMSSRLNFGFYPSQAHHRDAAKKIYSNAITNNV